ncbi:MAG: glycosyltransferase family 39 protein [Propionibacteriales bacterium]|nr:glycosyltransferase family 39 protein [Propionibacteriales bacterium]
MPGVGLGSEPRNFLRARHPEILGRWPAVCALTLVAALLRFPTLGLQSFGDDELYTVWLIRGGLTRTLAHVAETESTPHLYYAIAWVWAHLFGRGEVGLRSLSAFLGTATIPVVYLAALRLVSERAALIAVALVTVNPLLVWYSQEARAYAALVLLSTLSLFAFLRALEQPGTRQLGAWALVCAFAVATHYFALFLVAGEALWLLVRTRQLKAVLAASAVPLGALLLVAPTALHQISVGNPTGIEKTALWRRTVQVPKNFLVGHNSPLELYTTLAAGALALLALWLLTSRAHPEDRRGAKAASLLATCTIVPPLLLAVGGADYLSSRNVIAAVVPCAVIAAAGFAATRGGVAAAVCACLLSIGVVVAADADPGSRRRDWRGAAEALGTQPGRRAIVLTPSLESYLWVYLHGARPLPREGAEVDEIGVVGLEKEGEYTAGAPSLIRPASPPVTKLGFFPVELSEAETYTVIRFRSSRPRRVTPDMLEAFAIGEERGPAFLLQTAAPTPSRR